MMDFYIFVIIKAHLLYSFFQSHAQLAMYVAIFMYVSLVTLVFAVAGLSAVSIVRVAVGDIMLVSQLCPLCMLL